MTGGEVGLQRPVVRGQTLEDRVQIVSGLQIGERVVTEGADRLRDGSRVVLPGDAPRAAGEGGRRRRGGASAPEQGASAPQAGASQPLAGASAAKADLTPPWVPASAGAGARGGNLTPEEREARRQRIQALTPEERAAFRAQRQQRRQQEAGQ